MASAQKQARKSRRTARPSSPRLYTVEVVLLRGPVSRAFDRQNPVVSRTIQIRGDQTLADLHRAIFEAFGRQDDKAYEFQFGKGPMDPQGARYVLPQSVGMPFDEANPPAGHVSATALGSLHLVCGRRFMYWFDFEEDWWHQVTVADVRDKVPRGKFPRVSHRVGQSPPQAPEEDAENADADDPSDLQGNAAADTACLIGELHLSKRDYARAVEAFTRALEISPTADAYEGRAKAYRGLAAGDDRRADELR
jgi:tetratricopeptide (TPR) repeat protein